MHHDYTPKDIERFWGKVNVTDSQDDCWLWMHSCDGGGYGLLRVKDKLLHSNRIAYELTFGEIPEGVLVCHRCDRPSCCNPNHLFLGTHADNSRDRDKKGRNKLRKLTEKQVLEIRKIYANKEKKQAELANIYGVGRDEISRIVNYKRWA